MPDDHSQDSLPGRPATGVSVAPATALPRHITRTGFWKRQWRRFSRPSAMLLLAQLLQICLYPFMRFPSVRMLISAMSIIVLLLTLRLIHHTRASARSVAVIAVVVIALRVAIVVFDADAIRMAEMVTEALLYFYAAACLMDYMMADERATTDELFAAAATFMLLVWAFTQLLALSQMIDPGSFVALGEGIGPRDWSELMFLSFALFTNTGIGVVVPLTSIARAIGSIEMFSGVLYLAFIVARLIGMAVSEQNSRRKKD